MRNIVPHQLEEGRWREGFLGSDSSYGLNGIFFIRTPKNQKLKIIASNGPDWEHVSVSLQHRCPTWDEMCFVKELFWTDEETVIQYHPPKSEYVNFHPYCLCKMMAEMTIEGVIEQAIEKHGFATASEPACGAGAMVIALADTLHSRGINYQQHMHVTAVDIDIKCVHMAYLQFSLLHIPAVVVHGDTLRMEEYSHWHTPAHIMGGWQFKLRMRQKLKPIEEADVVTPSLAMQQQQLSLFNQEVA